MLLANLLAVGLGLNSFSYGPSIGDQADVGKTLGSALSASGAASDHGAWRLTGTARMEGTNQKYEMEFDGQLRYRSAIIGDLPQADGFDGTESWISGPSQLAHHVIGKDRDLSRMLAWAETGAWAMSSTPLTCTPASGDRGIFLKLHDRDGVGEATLVLDPSSYLPISFETTEESWRFDDYKKFGQRSLATRITHVSGQQKDVIRVQSAEKAHFDDKEFSLPARPTGDADFDDSVSRPLEIKRAAGLIFVHPAVDRQDVGWFILDTGADSMCIDPTVAKKLNMQAVGSDAVAGAVAVSQYVMSRGKAFQLGPLTFKRPIYIDLDLSGIGKALGLEVAGVCGYDVISRCDLDIDTQANTLRVLKPNSAPLPEEAAWTQFRFESNVPSIQCSFAGGDVGRFTVDTGSNSTVDFCAPAVEKYHFMQGKNLKPALSGGAGGSAKSWVGPIDWFELAGNRIEKPTVGFQVAKVGALSSPYHVGNIGMAFMGKFRLILNYANERIAFVKP